MVVVPDLGPAHAVEKNTSAQLVQAPSRLYASSWLMRFISKCPCRIPHIHSRTATL